MQSVTHRPYIDTEPLDIIDALKVAISKLPRIKKPVEQAVRFSQKLTPFPGNSQRVYFRSTTHESAQSKKIRIKRELLDAGVTVYGMLKAESRYLPKIIHDYEHIEAVIYGLHISSLAMLIATDERIIYLDKKPTVEMFDEVSYEVVSGIQFDIHLFFASVVLHTPVKNYDFRYVNLRCAEKFARHIERHRLEREPKQHSSPIEILPPRTGLNNTDKPDDFENMAGYYWLPNDEEERQKLQNTTTT